MVSILRIMLRYIFFVAVSLVGMISSVQSQVLGYTLTLVPPDPTTLEPVVARITNVQTCAVDPQTLRISQVGTTIRINISIGPQGCIPIGGNPTHDVLIGRFPPGDFTVNLFLGNTSLGSQQFTVSDSYPTKTNPYPLVDFTDHWWDPQELGWGVSIMQHTSDQVVATWFTYDQTEQTTWYSLQPGQWLSTFHSAFIRVPSFRPRARITAVRTIPVNCRLRRLAPARLRSLT